MSSPRGGQREHYSTSFRSGRGEEPRDTIVDPAYADRLVQQIETAARRALADPEYARRSGIAPRRATPLLDRLHGAPIMGEGYSDWLRGAAFCLLPADIVYSIDVGIGGETQLTIGGRRW